MCREDKSIGAVRGVDRNRVQSHRSGAFRGRPVDDVAHSHDSNAFPAQSISQLMKSSKQTPIMPQDDSDMTRK